MGFHLNSAICGTSLLELSLPVFNLLSHKLNTVDDPVRADLRPKDWGYSPRRSSAENGRSPLKILKST